MAGAQQPRVLLLLLTLVALERGGPQIALAELARDVERAGADVVPPLTVSTFGSAANAWPSPTGSTCCAPGACSSAPGAPG